MVSSKKYAEGKHANKMVCRVCCKDHPLRFCKQFLKEGYEERMRLVSIYKYCAGCLSHDHTWRTCESTGKCRRCGDMHHTLLHKPVERPRPSGQRNKRVKRLQKGPRSSDCQDSQKTSHGRQKRKGPSSSRGSANRPSSSKSQNSEGPSTSQAVVPVNSRNSSATRRKDRSRRHPIDIPVSVYQVNQMVMLKPTAVVKIVAKERYILERALIEPSAEYSTISEDVVKRLGAKTIKIGKTVKCLITIRGNFGMSATIETYAQVKRTLNIVTPSRTVDGAILDEFPGLQLADPQFHVAAPVNITLGGDVYSRIIRNGVFGGALGKPLAQFSIFGYIITGACSK